MKVPILSVFVITIFGLAGCLPEEQQMAPGNEPEEPDTEDVLIIADSDSNDFA